MKLKIILYSLSVMILSGCASMDEYESGDGKKLPSFVPGYYAIDPIVLGNVINIPANKKEDPDLKELYNIGSKSTQYVALKDGSIKYLSSGVERKSSQHFITVDHLIYSPIELKLQFEENGKMTKLAPVGLVLGIAIRIKANANAKSSDFALSDIPGLAISSQGGVAAANVEIEIIGIRNNTIVKLPRHIGELNASTLQTLMQNVATINAEINGDNTEIVPQIIGVDIKSLPKDVDVYDVVAAIRDWKLTRLSKGKKIDLKALKNDVHIHTYRSDEFVEKKRQKKIEMFLAVIKALSNKRSIELVKNPPVTDATVLKIVKLRDPTNKRLTDGKSAKEMLKMMVVMSERDDNALLAWEAALKISK